MAASLLFGCDAGPFHDQKSVGPPLAIVTAGTNIATGSTYTIDQPIRIAFDRFLNPETVTRQSLVLEDVNGNGVTNATIAYDPVTLTVSLGNPGDNWLTAGQQYKVVVNVAGSEGGTPYGLQAIDGAGLTTPQTLLFTAHAASASPVGAPTVDFCKDILGNIFSGCNYGGCHVAASAGLASIDGGHPRAGLDLSSPAGVRDTAIGQVADESNTGPLSAPAAATLTVPFGIDMPVITAGEPGNSWLMYKVLLASPTIVDAGAIEDAPAAMTDASTGKRDAARDAAEDAPGGMTATDAAIEDASHGMTGSSPDAAEDAPRAMTPSSTYGATSPVPAYERVILSNYVLGQAMPYPGGGVPNLTEAQLELLSLWIAEGAKTPASCQ